VDVAVRATVSLNALYLSMVGNIIFLKNWNIET
jgi:hypothetical protein